MALTAGGLSYMYKHSPHHTCLMIPIPGQVFRFPTINIFVQAIRKSADCDVYLVRDGFMIKLLLPSGVQACDIAHLDAYWDKERVGHLDESQLTCLVDKLTEADAYCTT